MKTPYHFFLALLMLVTGSINTITTKYADISCAVGVDYYNKGQSGDKNSCLDRSKGAHLFDHPFVQVRHGSLGGTKRERESRSENEGRNSRKELGGSGARRGSAQVVKVERDSERKDTEGECPGL